MSVQDLQEAMLKIAAGELETNEMVRGGNAITPKVEPSKVEERTEHTQAVEQEREKDRPEMLKRLFGGMSQASSKAKSDVNQLTDPAWRPYESHSALLQKNAAHAPTSPSLTSRVRSLLGRR